MLMRVVSVVKRTSCKVLAFREDEEASNFVNNTNFMIFLNLIAKYNLFYLFPAEEFCTVW